MVAFKSLVMFDLETTGLPQYEYGKTKIIEMSLVACVTSHCQREEIPRVINKMTLTLNPRKVILPEASQITGLENELLEEMKTFDDAVVSLLNGFLERLPQPVCLIAHNGLKFDFPILMRHLQKCKTQLVDNIYCADSLEAFRVILPNAENSKKKKWNTGDEVTSNSEAVSDVREARKAVELIERTPEKRTVQYNAQPIKAKKYCMSEKHSGVARKLDFNSDTHNRKNVSACDDASSNLTASQTGNSGDVMKSETQINQRQLKSYKLIDIYSYLHNGQTLTFHRSEDDCMALLSCINKCRDNFIAWLEYNAVLLKDVEPLI